MEERLARKTLLSMVALGAAGAIRLIFSVAVGRVFGPGDLGQANLVLSASVFATLLVSPGMGQAVARQLAHASSDGRDPFGRAVLHSSTTVHHLLLLACAVGTAAYVAGTADQRVEAALLTAGYGAYTYYKAILYGVDRVFRYAVLELAWDVGFVVLLVLVLSLRDHALLLVPLILPYLGFSVTAAAGFHGRGRGSGSGHVRLEPTLRRQIAGFAAATAVGTASSTGFLQLSMLSASHVSGGRDAGLFAAALTLVTPAYLLPRSLSVVLFPAMARASGREDHASVREQLRIGSHVLAAALLPGFVIASCLAPTLVSAVYGNRFADASTTFVVMVWATWVSIASVPAVNALSSARGRRYVIPAAAAAAGLLVGVAWWVWIGGTIESVAIGYLIGSFVQSGVPVWYAYRAHRVPSVSCWLRTLLAALASAAVSLMTGRLGSGEQVLVALAMTVLTVLALAPEYRGLWRTVRRLGRRTVPAATPQS